ncbi:MAG TPA: hypothetical protein VEI03_01950 [Stellaceae bacterium]|nr:hypothetical protein [Stellaceae bacterium]
MELLIPSGGELAGWGGVLAATLLFIGIGRLATAGRAAPETALVAGWGGACLLLTLWGVATSASLLFPAAAVLLLGLAGCLLPGLALPAPAWRGMGRILAVSLPLLAVMASARPSLPDTFLNLLPNAAYLWDHGFFPADGRAPSYSLLPGAPYNMQLAAFIVSEIARRLALNAMIGFNIALQFGLALLLARQVAGAAAGDAAPSWTAAALGLLLATLINPGFVPRYDLSAYSETSVGVATAFAAWLAAGALARLGAGRGAAGELTLLSLVLAALVDIKQDSVALAAGLVAASLALALLQPPRVRGRAIAALLLAAAPAAALYLAWRWYVLGHFAVGELKFLPVGQWQFGLVPIILRSMAGVVVQKAYFFLAAVAALAGLGWRWRRRAFDRTTAVAALFAGVAIVYNAALFFTYIAHFSGEIGASAHSYFRYNTHLGPLLMLTLVRLARDLALPRGWTLTRVGRVVAIAAALASPVIFFPFLRFDLDAPRQRAWLLAASASPALDRDRRLALLLPGDNDSLATMLEGLIRFAPPRHLDAELRVVTRLAPATLDALADDGYRFALLSCAPPGFAGVAPAQAALLERADGRWHPISVWAYPAAQLPVRRSGDVAPAPVCLAPPPGG